MKRWWLWCPLAVVVVALGGGGGVWAHQLIADNIAHSSYKTALLATQNEVQLAQTDGVFPSELQPYAQMLQTIGAMKAPNDKSFWSASAASFFTSESGTLRALTKQLTGQLAGMTHFARHDAHSLLRELTTRVRRARWDGLNAPGFPVAVRHAQLNFRSASTLGEYRELVGAIQPKLATISEQLFARQKDIRSVEHRAKSSAHPRRTAHAEVVARVSQARSDLKVLSVFHRVTGLTAWLNREAGWAVKRTHVRLAAIGAADVGTVESVIRDRMAKFVPAKWILVSTEDESMEWFQGTQEVGSSLVTTGNPQLPTVKGHFKIFAKFHPFTFVSSDPVGSEFYYPPSVVQYAMEFQSEGYFIHDAPWRSVFGPGSDGPGIPGTNYGGSHGCVNVPLNVAYTLFQWAPIGTTVIVV